MAVPAERPPRSPAEHPHWLAAGVALGAGDSRGAGLGLRPPWSGCGTSELDCRRGSALSSGGAGVGQARCGLSGSGELRVRPLADAVLSQEDVEAAPEETRGKREGAGRRQRRRCSEPIRR